MTGYVHAVVNHNHNSSQGFSCVLATERDHFLDSLELFGLFCISALHHAWFHKSFVGDCFLASRDVGSLNWSNQCFFSRLKRFFKFSFSEKKVSSWDFFHGSQENAPWKSKEKLFFGWKIPNIFACGGLKTHFYSISVSNHRFCSKSRPKSAIFLDGCKNLVSRKAKKYWAKSRHKSGCSVFRRASCFSASVIFFLASASSSKSVSRFWK